MAKKVSNLTNDIKRHYRECVPTASGFNKEAQRVLVKHRNKFLRELVKPALQRETGLNPSDAGRRVGRWPKAALLRPSKASVIMYVSKNWDIIAAKRLGPKFRRSSGNPVRTVKGFTRSVAINHPLGVNTILGGFAGPDGKPNIRARVGGKLVSVNPIQRVGPVLLRLWRQSANSVTRDVAVELAVRLTGLARGRKMKRTLGGSHNIR